jgi:RimJ/RimL family protein N-acetyltransferase/alpha-D-ribose 1-methylphosphonate 5-triphosphate synthase subunit PhnG
VETAQKYIESQLPSIQKGETLIFSVFQKESKKFIGLVSSFLLASDSPTIGLWIREDEHQKGYGFQMVSTVKNWLDSNIKYKETIYKAHPNNLGSRKIAQKLGGILLDEKFCMTHANGTKMDLVGYRINGNWTPKFKVLTDIQGLEDHHGDMDFKVTGTTEGITAIQLDNKVAGLTADILKQALVQSKSARIKILDIMKECISEPKNTTSQYAPIVAKVIVPLHKIGDVIGAGGKIIRAMEEKFGCDVDLENETGITYIYGKDKESVEKCQKYIEALLKVYQVGETISGKVIKILPFGAVLEIDGTSKEGMVHISKMANYRVAQVEDILKIGDTIPATIYEIKDNGNISLSLVY